MALLKAALWISIYGAVLSAGELRLLVWNIDRGYHLPEVSAVIRSLQPDISILQEVDRNARRTGAKDIAAELARDLHVHFVYGAAFEELGQSHDGEKAHQGQAVLSRLPLAETRVLRFTNQTRFWEPRPYLPSRFLQRRRGGRIALATEALIPHKRLIIYNLHLESRGFGYTRYAQLKEVIDDVKRYPLDTPIVIAGDLNTKYARERFVRLLENAGFRNCFGTRRERTHHIMFTLDWVFVRGPIECETAQVHKEVRVSDHYPLTANLRID